MRAEREAALISRSLRHHPPNATAPRSSARQTGFINLALHFEKMCDDAYKQLGLYEIRAHPDSHFGHESQQCYWPSSRNFLRRREPHQ